MQHPTRTHLVLDARDVVQVWASDADYAERQAIILAANTARTATVVDLYAADTDVATLARIAAADMPALLRQGEGFLGAGTHVAQPYLSVMLGMRGVNASNVKDVTFGWDHADRIVITFLSNASTWKGETARAVKAALKALVA